MPKEPMLWKVACQEDRYPGMWQRWFRSQCVAVGWAAKWGYKLVGPTKGGRGWSVARNALNEMRAGDHVPVALRGSRIGRIGEITGKAIGDEEWTPMVPAGVGLPDGEMGRRVFVRWDLTTGPDNQNLIVQLPKGSTLTQGELRPTLSRIRSHDLEAVRAQMNDAANWVNLLGRFRYERALSDYIANYPNHLEDGLLPHPNSKIRERVFKDRTRLDVILLDRTNRPVIVECKQSGPTVRDLKQLRAYMRLFREETGEMPRGILVHGGAAKIERAISAAASSAPLIEIVSYNLEVRFRTSLVGDHGTGVQMGSA